MTILRGENVTLRPVQNEDWPTLYEFRNDLEIHMLADDDPPIPRSWEQAKKLWEGLQEKEPDNPWFAIEVDGKFIGDCGLFHFDKVAANCELGISIGDHDYWGKGYGTQAVKMIVDYAFRHLNQHKVYLTVTADNERAVASYKKCGFVEEVRMRDAVWVDGAYRDSLLMSILAEEWSSGEVR